ncbi:MAG: putative Na+/H+ antiporter [Bdellovibrionales bacterium]|nr:putative Na+/H+ antiporter [Bdellovibrionales bacterium]
MLSHTSEIWATLLFAVAIFHTFLVKKFIHLSHKFPKGSIRENIFHLLGEVEVVFGLWATIFFIALIFTEGLSTAVHYLEARNFTEAVFVFVIMTVCSTRPILQIANTFIKFTSTRLPLPKSLAFYVASLVVGPLMGSFITEPAAMTVTALLLLHRFFEARVSAKLKYVTLGLLFVNVSIGGTLTNFAAPPVLMVASKWNWDTLFMMQNFGWKGGVAIVFSTAIVAYRFRSELSAVDSEEELDENMGEVPALVCLMHVVFLGLIIVFSHYITVFVGLFLLFLGLVSVTREFHHSLKLKEGMLVASFLAGLIVIGAPQHWWIAPLITKVASFPLYLGAISLTAITDNAALTYLGSLVPNLSDSSKYALVAGSVVGGGLTVIANAPNPAGFGILNRAFGTDGISPWGLFKAALFPTILSGIIFWIF